MRAFFNALSGRAFRFVSLIVYFCVSPAFAEGPKPALVQFDNFVSTKGTAFMLGGKPFFVVGVNNHYLTFGSEAEVISVLDDATAMGANVVRIFLQPVIGSLDGSVSTIWYWKRTGDSSDLATHGNFMLAWDSREAKMVMNDGANGLQRVDFVLAEAKKRNLKLIVGFLDFWSYAGGAQQMNAWYGSQDKYTFFAQDSRTRADYKQWVSHVVNRTNAITGVSYANDPTIFAWELMNEPDIHPFDLLFDWLSEMTAFVKSLDKHHLLSTGHANISTKLADLKLPNVDFGTWHGYPAYEKISADEFNELIKEYCARGAAADKPVLLEEFGMARSDTEQASAYREWLSTIWNNPSCGGWLVWRLVSKQESGKYPVDEVDQFDVHNDGGDTWLVLKEAAMRSHLQQRLMN